MTALKTTQQTALDNLAALLTEATTGLRKVYIDLPDAIVTPCLIVADNQECIERRLAQWREIEWDLEFRVYVQQSQGLARAYDKARDIRGDLMDRLGTDVTLSTAISRSFWKQGPRITGLQWGTVDHVGILGIYTLIIREGYSFA